MTDPRNDSSTTITPSASGKQMLRIPLDKAGSISAVVSMILIVVSWIGGYITFKGDMKLVSDRQIETQAGVRALNDRVDTMNKSVNEDRQMVRDRLTGLENKTEYIHQSIGKIELAIVPKR